MYTVFYIGTINALNNLSTVNMEIINKPSLILQKRIDLNLSTPQIIYKKWQNNKEILFRNSYKVWPPVWGKVLRLDTIFRFIDKPAPAHHFYSYVFIYTMSKPLKTRFFITFIMFNEWIVLNMSATHMGVSFLHSRAAGCVLAPMLSTNV